MNPYRRLVRIRQRIFQRFLRAAFADHVRRLEALERRADEAQSTDRSLMRELVRLTGRLNVVAGATSLSATKDELQSSLAEATRNLEYLRLLHDEEITDGSAHRAYMGREIERVSREGAAYRDNIEAALRVLIERLDASTTAASNFEQKGSLNGGAHERESPDRPACDEPLTSRATRPN